MTESYEFEWNWIKKSDIFIGNVFRSQEVFVDHCLIVRGCKVNWVAIEKQITLFLSAGVIHEKFIELYSTKSRNEGKLKSLFVIYELSNML